MKVSVGTKNPIKTRAVKDVFTRVYDMVEVSMVDVKSGVSAQPSGHEVMTGAKHRAERAFMLLKGADLGVGIESGLFNFCGVLLDVQICSIFDGGIHTVGASPGFGYPEAVLEGIRKGREVGSIMEVLSGVEGIGRKMGAIGYLSKGLIDRTHFTELCVIMALIPRMNPELYKLP
jgi:inosine/xanthosine triphosphatase